MARQRMLHPEIWTSESFLELNLIQRLLWIGIFSLADDEGRIKINSLSLKARIFPTDNISIQEIDKALVKLETLENIKIYNSKIGKIAQIINWSKYQKISHPQGSKLPPIEDAIPFTENSENIHGTFTEYSVNITPQISLDQYSIDQISIDQNIKDHDSINKNIILESISGKMSENSDKIDSQEEINMAEKTENLSLEGSVPSVSDNSPLSVNPTFILDKPVLLNDVPKSKNNKIGKEFLEAIKNIHNEELVRFPKVQTLNKERISCLSARIKEDKEREELDWWRNYFKSINQRGFLCGENERGWIAGFDWIIKPNNMIKILEGGYNSQPVKKYSEAEKAAASTPSEILKKSHWTFQKNVEEIKEINKSREESDIYDTVATSIKEEN